MRSPARALALICALRSTERLRADGFTDQGSNFFFPHDLELVLLFSLVPLLASLLLAQRYPEIASAFALMGRLS